MPQRLIRHDGTQVRAADADVDDVADAFAGMARPFAAADPIGERGHLVEDGVDSGHDVSPSTTIARPSVRAGRRAAPRAFPSR